MHRIERVLLLLLFTLFYTSFAVTDTIVIQHGVAGYFGGSDSYIGEGQPANTTNQGGLDYMNAGRC